MKLPISQEKGPFGWKCEHYASFLGTRNRLSNARENSFPGGYGLSLRVDYLAGPVDVLQERIRSLDISRNPP